MSNIKTTTKKVWNKITSRKFLAAITGIISGIVLIKTGSTSEGTALIGSSIVGYMIAEGYVDAKSAAASASAVATVATSISSATADTTTTNKVADAVETAAESIKTAAESTETTTTTTAGSEA